MFTKLKVPIRTFRQINSGKYAPWLLFFCPALLALWASAQEKKEEKKPEPPVALLASPIGVLPGITNLLSVRGLNLSNVTAAKLEVPGSHLKVLSRKRAELGKDQNAKIIGDTQVDLELFLPKDFTSTNFGVVMVSADGESKPLRLFLCVMPTMAEKEPNGGFAHAQELSSEVSVQGVIHEAKDVDVFQFRARKKDTILVEIYANRFGSALDSILGVYDSEKRLIADNDDFIGIDSRLFFMVPEDGLYYVTLIDAHDKGGPGHIYLLEIIPRSRAPQVLQSFGE